MGGARRRTATAVALAAVAVAAPAGAAGEPPAFHPYWTYDVGSWPSGVAVGDVTGDGLADVLLTTSFYFDAENDYRLFVFAQQPDGSLGAPARLATTGATNSDEMGLVIADLDGDGDNDAGVATKQGVDVFTQEAGQLSLNWTVPVPDAMHLEAADVSGDGFADLVVVARTGVHVWWQINGDFMPSPVDRLVTSEWSYFDELEVADVTGDGLVDVVQTHGTAFHVFAGAADRSFGDAVVYPSGPAAPWNNINGAAVGDIDGDGRNDVALTISGNRPNSAIVVRYQQPDGTLGTPLLLASYDIPESVEIADVTADARADVVVLHSGWSRAGVYTQQPDGSLGAENLYTVPYGSYAVKGLSIGDVSGDGTADVAIADDDDGLVLLRGAGLGADTTPPETTITAGPSGTVRSRTATFAFTSSEPGSTFACSMDTSSLSPCTSPVTYSGLAAGAHTFRVRATDAAGNQDASPAQRTIIVDGPETTITSGPTGTVRSTSATFEFTASPPAASFECSHDGSAWLPCTSPATYAGLAYGTSHTFRVRGVSGEGIPDSTPATRSYAVEAAANVGVSVADTPDPVRRGRTLTYTTTVTNAGPAVAASVAAAQGLPAGVTFGSVTSTAGSCTASGAPATIRCSFGTLASGATATVTITTTVTASKGTLASTAVVSTTTWDPVAANDSASASTTVGNGR